MPQASIQYYIDDEQVPRWPEVPLRFIGGKLQYLTEPFIQEPAITIYTYHRYWKDVPRA